MHAHKFGLNFYTKISFKVAHSNKNKEKLYLDGLETSSTYQTHWSTYRKSYDPNIEISSQLKKYCKFIGLLDSIWRSPQGLRKIHLVLFSMLEKSRFRFVRNGGFPTVICRNHVHVILSWAFFTPCRVRGGWVLEDARLYYLAFHLANVFIFIG